MMGKQRLTGKYFSLHYERWRKREARRGKEQRDMGRREGGRGIGRIEMRDKGEGIGRKEKEGKKGEM